LVPGDNTGVLIGLAAIVVGLLLWVVMLRRQIRRGVNPVRPAI